MIRTMLLIVGACVVVYHVIYAIVFCIGRIIYHVRKRRWRVK